MMTRSISSVIPASMDPLNGHFSSLSGSRAVSQHVSGGHCDLAPRGNRVSRSSAHSDRLGRTRMAGRFRRARTTRYAPMTGNAVHTGVYARLTNRTSFATETETGRSDCMNIRPGRRQQRPHLPRAVRYVCGYLLSGECLVIAGVRCPAPCEWARRPAGWWRSWVSGPAASSPGGDGAHVVADGC